MTHRYVFFPVRGMVIVALTVLLLDTALPVTHRAQDVASATPVARVETLPVPTATATEPITETPVPMVASATQVVSTAPPSPEHTATETIVPVSPSSTDTSVPAITVSSAPMEVTATEVPALAACGANPATATVPPDCILPAFTPDSTSEVTLETVPVLATAEALPVAFPTTTTTPALTGSAGGWILRPGTDATGIEVFLIQGTTITAVTTTLADGSFLFTGLSPAAYRILALSEGYLLIEASVTLEPGAQVMLAPVMLVPGDINRDNRIDAVDVNILVQSYGSAVPPAAPEADLNHDGQVNLIDFEIIARSYGKVGPVPWR